MLSPTALPLAISSIGTANVVSVADDRCGDGYEWSKTMSSCILVPTAAPAAPPGATFQCNDGDYSFSKTAQGTCSRHRGIFQSL